MHLPSARARRVAAAAVAVLSLGSGYAAQAVTLSTSVSTTFETTVLVPVVPSLSQRIKGVPPVFTPGLRDGRLDLGVSASDLSSGVIYTSSDFVCQEGSAPNPVLAVYAAGPHGGASISARITGTTTGPTGEAISVDETLDEQTHEFSTFEDDGVPLYELCSD